MFQEYRLRGQQHSKYNILQSVKLNKEKKSGTTLFFSYKGEGKWEGGRHKVKNNTSKPPRGTAPTQKNKATDGRQG